MAPRKSSGAAAPSSSTSSGKHKTFSFSKQLEGAISKSPGKNSPARANDKPHFSIRRTVNQTTGEESQNRQALFRSRYAMVCYGGAGGVTYAAAQQLGRVPWEVTRGLAALVIFTF